MAASVLHFESHGTTCEGTLYSAPREGGAPPPPIIIMGHGFGAERDAGLAPFAERFVAMGFSVFAFDYRHFGGSGGEPRRLLSVKRQHQDWHAALAFVRGRDDIDASRVVLWGSSYGGGHVLAVAADDGNVQAVISHVPYVDAASSVPNFSPALLAKLTFHGLWDILLSPITGRRHYVPIVGPPGSSAVLSTPECEPGYLAMVPEGSTWENKVAARIGLFFPLYSPKRWVRRIKCPVLVVAGKHDSLVPISGVRATVACIPDAHLVELDANHFDPYRGEVFEANVAAQVAFLEGLHLV